MTARAERLLKLLPEAGIDRSQRRADWEEAAQRQIRQAGSRWMQEQTL